MDSNRASEVFETGEQYTTYIGFNKYDSAQVVKSKYQIADEWSDCKIRGEFDTLQAIEEIYIPTTNGNTTDIPEPITASYPQYGVGGDAQARVDKIIHFSNVEMIGD